MQGESGGSEQQVGEQRTRFRFRPVYLILLALMALFAFKFLQKTQEIRQLAAQEAAAQYQNDQIAQENERLQRAIAYYHTPAYVENEAREALGYTMPGDVPIQTQPIQQRIVQVRPAPLPTSPPEPTWKQWWHAFFP